MIRKTPFSKETDYVNSILALLRLHELNIQGLEESNQADIERDTLERYWHSLSEIEQKRLSGLSADLNSISKSSTKKDMNPQAHDKLAEVLVARQSGQWDKALELLHRWGAHLKPEFFSYFTASIWEEAGDSAVASVFFKHAVDLNPDNTHYHFQYLQALRQSNPEIAKRCAREILANHQQYPRETIYNAAVIHFISTTDTMSKTDAKDIFKELVRIVKPLVIQQESSDPDINSMYSIIIVLIAFCYSFIGEKSCALDYFNKSLTIDPSNHTILESRGILLYGKNAEAARDFESAIRLGSNSEWAFFFLAHHHLINENFTECIRLSERALELTSSDLAKAELHEWIAISRCELGMYEPYVREAFEEALRLAPNNEKIKNNFNLYKNAVDRKESSIAWQKATEAEVQALGHAEFRPSLAA